MSVVKYTSWIKHWALKMVELESRYNCYIWSQANQGKGAAHSVEFVWTFYCHHSSETLSHFLWGVTLKQLQSVSRSKGK